MTTDRVFNHVQYKYAHLSDIWKFRTKYVGRQHLNAFFFNNLSKGDILSSLLKTVGHHVRTRNPRFSDVGFYKSQLSFCQMRIN